MRAFFAGVVRKKLGLNLVSKGQGKERIYCITSAGSAKEDDAVRSEQAADPSVGAGLDRLLIMNIADLRKRYRELFRAEPPKAFGPDLLRRSIAYRIQETAYGGSRDLTSAVGRPLEKY